MSLASSFKEYLSRLVHGQTEVEINTAFDAFVDPSAVIVINGAHIDTEEWRQRWHYNNAHGKDRKLTLHVVFGTDDGPVSIKDEEGRSKQQDTIGIHYTLDFLGKYPGQEDWTPMQYYRLGVVTFKDGKLVDLRLAMLTKAFA